MFANRREEMPCHSSNERCRICQQTKLCCCFIINCGSSHWRCPGLNFVTFNLVPRPIYKTAHKFIAVKLLMFSVSPPMYSCKIYALYLGKF